MSRELDMLAKQYQKVKATVIRKDLNLYQTTVATAASGFLREVEKQCKQDKQPAVVLIGIVVANESQ